MAQTSPFLTIDTLLGGYVFSQLIYVAAKLGLADLAWEAPRTIEELAALVHVETTALRRVMASLVFLGIFEQKEHDAYQLAHRHHILLSDHPDSIRSYAIVSGEVYYRAFSELLASVESGKTGCAAALGQDFFPYLNEHPHLLEHFNAHMSQRMRRDAEAALAVYNFTPYQHVVDIGGGNGMFISLLLQKHAHLQGTLFDLPPTVAQAEAFLRHTGVAERCTLRGGDFFLDELPANGDLYILSLIVHDWDDDNAVRILKNCRRAMSKTSKLILLEFVVTEQQKTARQAMEDLFMLVVTGGRERTEEQFRKLLAEAGLQLTSHIPTEGRRSILEAIPTLDL